MGMRIGLTYDLIDDYLSMGFSKEDAAEFDKQETIDALDNAIKYFGFTTDRIGHVKNLSNRLNKGDTWDLVFNIAEGVKGFSREAQVPALLDAYDIPYTFSDPLVLCVALHKGITKQIVQTQGIPTAPFCVIEHPRDIEKVNIKYPLFAKPVAEGTGKGVSEGSFIKNKGELTQQVNYLLERFAQPVLVEQFLPGREFTVGIVGNGVDAQVLGSMEILAKSDAEQFGYTYLNKQNFEKVIQYKPVIDEVARESEQVALAAWKALGCRDCGRIEIRCDENNKPCFVEVNPLAGLNPHVSDLPILCKFQNIEYKFLIGMILREALLRLGKEWQVKALPHFSQLANLTHDYKKSS